MTSLSSKPRLLILIVAYNAEKTIQNVLRRIPVEVLDHYHMEVLINDDSSKDRTFRKSYELVKSDNLPFAIHILYNPVNQGYGGNQKIGFHYAIEKKFDFVALVHGDGQYAPECLPELVKPLANDEAEAVFGSRMLSKGGARQGKMPLYKYVGNKILTKIENTLLRAKLSEFHSGYRVYSVKALARVPFHRNTNVFHFDTEIIIQFLLAGHRIKELPIPTYYGDEICHVNGLKYAWDVVMTSLKARVQELNLFYDRKFDCKPPGNSNTHYKLKLDFGSPHSLACKHIPDNSRVLNLGRAGAGVGAYLMQKGCHVVGMDPFPLDSKLKLSEFHQQDLNEPIQLDLNNFDYVLILDLIEHLQSPEKFVDQLKESTKFASDVKLIVSTGNVGFIIVRLMLLLGQFNYSKKGILDLTHTRLFTFASLERLFQQAGFKIVKRQGIPAPFPLALGPGFLSSFFLLINNALIRISKSLFSYQIYFELKPTPSIDTLLLDAEEHASHLSKEIETGHR